MTSVFPFLDFPLANIVFEVNEYDDNRDMKKVLDTVFPDGEIDAFWVYFESAEWAAKFAALFEDRILSVQDRPKGCRNKTVTKIQSRRSWSSVKRSIERRAVKSSQSL